MKRISYWIGRVQATWGEMSAAWRYAVVYMSGVVSGALLALL